MIFGNNITFKNQTKEKSMGLERENNIVEGLVTGNKKKIC